MIIFTIAAIFFDNHCCYWLVFIIIIFTIIAAIFFIIMAAIGWFQNYHHNCVHNPVFLSWTSMLVIITIATQSPQGIFVLQCHHCADPDNQESRRKRGIEEVLLKVPLVFISLGGQCFISPILLKQINPLRCLVPYKIFCPHLWHMAGQTGEPDPRLQSRKREQGKATKVLATLSVDDSSKSLFCTGPWLRSRRWWWWLRRRPRREWWRRRPMEQPRGAVVVNAEQKFRMQQHMLLQMLKYCKKCWKEVLNAPPQWIAVTNLCQESRTSSWVGGGQMIKTSTNMKAQHITVLFLI